MTFAPSAHKLHATGYIRWSSDRQSDSTSLSRQRMMIREAADMMDWTVANEIRDEGVSGYFGTNLDDGHLGEFIRECEREGGHGKAIVVEMISRISRLNSFDALMAIGRMIGTGLTVVIADQRMVIDSTSIRNQRAQLEAIVNSQEKAHREIEDRVRLVRMAWQIMRKEGRPTHCRSTCPAWLEMDAKRTRFLAINELSAPAHHRIGVINEIFDLYIAGTGFAGIARILNQRQEPTFRGGDGWRSSSVKALIHNRAVIGEYEHHVARKATGEVVGDYFPAIVSNEKFAAANATAHRKVMASHSHDSKTLNLFSDVAHCGECGSKMTFINKSKVDAAGDDWTYLRCDSYHRGNGCTSKKMVRYCHVERAFLDTFLSRILDDQHFVSGDDVAEIRRKMADAQRTLDDAERSVKNIGDSLVTFAAHESLRRDFELRLMTASVERDAAVAVMDELRSQLEAASGKVSRAEHIRRVGDIRADLKSGDRARSEQAGRLIKMAIHDVVEDIIFDVHAHPRVTIKLVRSLGCAIGPLAGPFSFFDTLKRWKGVEQFADLAGDVEPPVARYFERDRQSQAS